jgi:hypothetical protein
LKINHFSKDIQKQALLQNALCDTCVASFEGAISENRLLAKQISDENYKLYLKYNEVIILEQEYDSLIFFYQSKIKHLKK